MWGAVLQTQKKKGIVMSTEEKIEILAEIFDCDAGEITPDKPLDELTWDSMAMLSVIAMVKAKFNRKVPGAQIRAFKTVNDVLSIMQAE